MGVFDPIRSRFGAARRPTREHKQLGDFLDYSGVRDMSGGMGYRALVRHGFQRNPVASRCVRMIAEACASVPLRCLQGGAPAPDHPLSALLEKPNPLQTGHDLLERLFGFLLLHGNGYVECAGGMRDGELYVLRPDRIKIYCDANGWPQRYDYTVDGRVHSFPASNSDTAILHIRFFHPFDDHYGLSPMETAARAIEIHNAANQWNKSLFENAARPSGALVYKGNDGAPHLTEEQFDRLKSELANNFSGTQNAGRPLLLEGGLDWTSISMSPQDMDFIAAKNGAARDIALAFGVPPMLLGIPGDNTYANFAEANRAFWRQGVLPLCNRVARALSKHLCAEGSDVTLAYDYDAVPALAEDRNRLFARLQAADFMTVDEKRAAVGLPPRDAKESS